MNFIIILNSSDLTSWNGSDMYNCNYNINIPSLLEYNYDYKKIYELTFNFRSDKALIIKGQVYGVFIDNISSHINTQENMKTTHLLGLLDVKSINKNADVLTNEEHNQPVILNGVNPSSILSLSIRKLIDQTTNTRTLGLTSLINWYRFLLADLFGSNVYNHTTLANDGVLNNEATITTDNILDLTSADSYMSFPNFNYNLHPTNALTFSSWFSSTNIGTTITLFCIDFTRLNITDTQVNCLFEGVQIISFNYNGSFLLKDGKNHLIQYVFGNTATHKLYIDSILVGTGNNSVSQVSGIETNTFLGCNRTNGNNVLGYMSDFRLYGRELTEQEINDYYYNSSLSQNPDYIIKLEFEELV